MCKHIFLSAAFLHLSLYKPQLFFWLSFFWLVPIFYIAIKNKLSFKCGLLWGVFFYLFHLYPITQLVMSENSILPSFIFSTALILYSAFHSGVWLWSIQKMNAFSQNFWWRLFSFMVGTSVYLLWIPYGLLWISGSVLGYPFSFPLLPLAVFPSLLWALPILGRAVLIFFLVGVSLSIALFFVSQKKRFLFFVFLFFLPFLIGCFVSKKEKASSDFFCRCGHVKPLEEHAYAHPLDAAQELYRRMRALVKKYPHVKYIFMPELSYRFPLNVYPHVVDLWNKNLLKNEIQLFIGGYRKENGKTFNSLYHIKNGVLDRVYDKCLLVPFVEYIPKKFEAFSFLKNLFLKDRGMFSPGKYRCTFDCGDGVLCAPHICAEFFFANNKEKNDFTLLVLNDAVFSSSFFNELVFLWCAFKAKEQCRNIVVIGYESAFLITTFGRRKKLFPLHFFS